jgi:hypothetical protein
VADLLNTLLGTGVLIGVVGWFVSHRLTSRREETARRDNAARSHLEAQIEQLYGPLLGHIQYSRFVYEVATHRLAPSPSEPIDFTKLSTNEGEIWRFFVESYFLPNNARIRDIIRAKMHLLDEGILPQSFEAFLRHEAQFEALHRLWKEKEVETPPSKSMQSGGWPLNFEQDVAETFGNLRSRHQAFLRRLGVTHGPSAAASRWRRRGTDTK